MPAERLAAELMLRGWAIPVRVVEPPPVTPVLTLEQIYTAIRIDDREADRPVVVEGELPPGAEVWLGPIPLAPRVCVQRYFTMWGDPPVQVAFGVDSKENVVGPFFLPPAPGVFEFIKYFVKRIVYIWLKNNDQANPAEFHIVACAVMPLEADWEKHWWPRIRDQVNALKGTRRSFYSLLLRFSRRLTR